MLGPGMNIARTPYNGRNFEYFGEDPYLASQTAVSVIKGIQDNPVIADAKHYALNNQEIDRMTVDVKVNERVAREIYLPAFEASVKKADVGSVMCSYNRVNTKYACENPTLLTKYLRDDWGFDGFVVSDWGAVHSTAASANAGLDLEMHAFAVPTPATPVTGAGGRFFDAPQAQGGDVLRDSCPRRASTRWSATSSARCSSTACSTTSPSRTRSASPRTSAPRTRPSPGARPPRRP